MSPDRPGPAGRCLHALRRAWALRHELDAPPRSRDQSAFLPAALSLQDTPVHPAPRWLARALIALFCIALGWSVLGHIDVVAVAPGRLVVSERTKLIQPLERSVVRRIAVRDGDHVEAGQLLVELDPTTAQADRASIGEQGRAAQAELLRARALLDALQSGAAPQLQGPTPADWTVQDARSARQQLQAEWSELQARNARGQAERERRLAEQLTVQESVAKLEALLPLARQREADFLRLSAQGFMSHHAGQDRTRERIELERDLATQRARLAEVQAATRESEQALSALRAEAVRSLRDREAEASLRWAQAREEEAKALHRERLTTLSAPVSGIVQQLAVHTSGGVVTEAQPLMVIVPEAAQLVAEVALENKDIGFVHAGQAAEVKLETFPFTRYGTVPARVLHVTPDAVQDDKRGAVFLATLVLERMHIDVDGRPIALSAGMNASVEIKTGHRRVIEFLLSPIQRAGRESLRER
ncbi:HlyD family type I secretion periplasmic adaptor subunit [Ramlibacter rhizophilus]|uniref:Membrane fusion protein (MFP) family protein n=1 Tax=Ramlibacter rhizophilus TaxID=1781167 RepID=A0A4Z0BBE8_9BURK|nr:HlyD family type I secretion periplasmic adaptor subunit [Ramlibacter rhizophilus]TFY96446.1 HlyD family type I secretion periplasmic adaptor subunit [Ramlibacter rhizophilus]